jgi:ribonucleoside-diphosphate reductase alpha chain
MQLTAEHASNRSPSASPDQIQLDESMASHVTHADYKIIRRNGAVVAFEPAKISIAMTKAFLAVNGGQGAASARVREQVARAHRLRWSMRWCAASRTAAPSTSKTSRIRSNWR